MIDTAEDEWFEIQNLVCVGELSHSLHLNTIAVNLGFENTEYEPEQFPGLIYRQSNPDSVVLLFASGRVVITGVSDLDSAERTYETLQKNMRDIHVEHK
jgi:transcription initiation factor TFIID TATA-box-binding protein